MFQGWPLPATTAFNRYSKGRRCEKPIKLISHVRNVPAVQKCNDQNARYPLYLPGCRCGFVTYCIPASLCPVRLPSTKSLIVMEEASDWCQQRSWNMQIATAGLASASKGAHLCMGAFLTFSMVSLNNESQVARCWDETFTESEPWWGCLQMTGKDPLDHYHYCVTN